jgi:regulatory protein
VRGEESAGRARTPGTSRRGARSGTARRAGADAEAAANAAPKTPDDIRELALKALERRRRTRSELATWLRQRGVSTAESAPILDRLTEVGLLDDLEYARVYLARRAASRPRGARLLRLELLAKGVPAELADQALDERGDDADPVAEALKAARPLLSRGAGLDPRARKQRYWAFLARRGFSTDVIERAWREAGAPDGDDGE